MIIYLIFFFNYALPSRCGRVIDCLGENLLHLTAHTLTEGVFLTGEIEQVAPNWVNMIYVFPLRAGTTASGRGFSG